MRCTGKRSLHWSTSTGSACGRSGRSGLNGCRSSGNCRSSSFIGHLSGEVFLYERRTLHFNFKGNAIDFHFGNVANDAIDGDVILCAVDLIFILFHVYLFTILQ